MSELSPAAQAVLNKTAEQVLADRRINMEHIAAAALRAAVDQVISDVTPPIDDCDQYSVGSAATHRKYRRQLLAIAAELEGKQNQKPTERTP